LTKQSAIYLTFLDPQHCTNRVFALSLWNKNQTKIKQECGRFGFGSLERMKSLNAGQTARLSILEQVSSNFSYEAPRF
jgi:hypothetical protein